MVQKEKGFVFIPLLILLVAGIVIVTLLTKNTASRPEVDNANWKTYTNESHGFSFRYSETYTLAEQENSDESYSTFTFTDQTRTGHPSLSLEFSNTGIITGGLLCATEISYSIVLEGNNVALTERNKREDNLKYCDSDLSVSVSTSSIGFYLHESVGYNFDVPNFPFKSIRGLFSFDRSGPNYESELIEIIKTMTFDRSIFR